MWLGSRKGGRGLAGVSAFSGVRLERVVELGERMEGLWNAGFTGCYRGIPLLSRGPLCCLETPRSRVNHGRQDDQMTHMGTGVTCSELGGKAHIAT